MSLSFEILITLFFWSVLFPLMKKSSLYVYLDHIAPFALLSIDYTMNRMPVNLHHIGPTFVILVMYGFVNMIYTLTTGHPVYPVMTFKDFWTLLFLFIAAIIDLGGYYGLYLLTRWKISKIQHMDEEIQNTLTLFDTDGKESP
jgi:hypothetical protein